MCKIIAGRASVRSRLSKVASVSRRFYFVGDEDLLEIIGNSKNVAKLQKHFKKMFAGVSSILLNEDSTEVLGISSREGEEVRLILRQTSGTSGMCLFGHKVKVIDVNEFSFSGKAALRVIIQVKFCSHLNSDVTSHSTHNSIQVFPWLLL